MNFVNSVGKRSAHGTHGNYSKFRVRIVLPRNARKSQKLRVRIVLPRNARNPQKLRVRIVLSWNARKLQKFRVRREETTESVVKMLILSGGLRSPPDWIAFATRSDCVRRPHRQRTENDDKT